MAPDRSPFAVVRSASAPGPWQPIPGGLTAPQGFLAAGITAGLKPSGNGGMVKGSGMIHPAMATMLGDLSCDAAVPPEEWQAMVSRAVARSFNAITVDGDTRTNDTFLAFAGGEPLGAEHWEALEQGATAVAQHLDGPASCCQWRCRR